MAQSAHQIPWIDSALFRENQKRFPAEELAKYAGQHVAWSQDGTRILASGNTLRAVADRLREAGIDPGTVVFDFVDSPDEVRL
jgi:hypothetical protein